MARAKASGAKKGRGKNGKSVKDYQRGDAATGYEVAVDGEGDGRNSTFEPDGQEMMDFKDLLLGEWATIKAIDDEARLKKEGPRGAIKRATKMLVESGYHAKELATMIRKWRLEHKLEHIADNLDEDQQSFFDGLVRALGQFGDTPLGKAALQAAGEDLELA